MEYKQTFTHIFKLSEDCNINIQNLIQEQLAKKLSNKFDDLIIEGLKRKGFEFESTAELESFIKENCKCADYPDEYRRVYYVKNEPFMLHDYSIDIPDIKMINNSPTITASYGSYAYL
jgi:hypothetical protein